MASKDKEEGVADVAELGLVATGAVVGGPIGAGVGLAATLVAKLPKALQRGRKARETRFINRVVHHLEEQDPGGAAEFIASHSETAEFADTLERGYEAMRRALDPTAEECICLLTADHARQGRPTGRRFVRAAALLEVCDLSMLRTLNLITTAYIAAGEEGENRLLFHCDYDCVYKTPASFFIVAYSGLQRGTSGHVFAPNNLRRLLVDLAHHDYGKEYDDDGRWSPPKGIPDIRSRTPSCRHHFLPEHQQAIHALHTYLAPVRLTMTKADRDDEQAVILEHASVLERRVQEALERAALEPPKREVPP